MIVQGLISTIAVLGAATTHHRRGAFLAEMPVGEAHTADILELGRRGFVEIDVRHRSSPVMLIASPSGAQIRSRVSHSGCRPR